MTFVSPKFSLALYSKACAILAFGLMACNCAVFADDTLSGGVKTDATVEASLKDLDKSWHHLKSAAWDCFCEVQQPQTFYVGGPDLIGGMVIPAINGTGNIATGQFLPPRPKWLKYYSHNAQYLAPQINSEVETLALPDSLASNPTCMDQLAKMKVLAAAFPGDAAKLAALTQNPPYENMPIATAAQVLINDLDAFEKLRKDLEKAIKEDAKHKRK